MTPTISQQAMLVSLGFTFCRQSVQLVAEAREIETKAHAEPGVTTASVYYFRRKVGSKIEDALAPLKSYTNEWRTQHNRLTRIWDSDNTRLLAAALAEQYNGMKNKYEGGYGEVKDNLLATYPEWRASAPERMGNLYQSGKFPTLEEVTNSIGFSVAYLPLPDSEQWKRIAMISPDLASVMESTTNERVAKAVAEATAQTWQDVLTPLQHVVDVLGKDGKIKIYETLLGSVLDITQLVPAFNLESDPKLAELAAQAQAAFKTISVEDLRTSGETRKSVLKSATTLINSFTPFARKFA